MADNVPKLRRLLNEARERIRELESRPDPEPVRVEVVREVEVPGPERVVEKPVQFDVEKIVYRDVIKEVEVPVAMYPESVRRVETERVIYYDNPDHIAMIRSLQARIAELTGDINADTF